MIHDATIEAEYLAMALSPIYRDNNLFQISSKEFYDPKRASIFAALERLHARGAKADPIEVAAETNIEVGEIRTLASSPPIVLTVDDHARRLLELATCRRAFRVAEDLRELALEGIGSSLAEYAGRVPEMLASPLAEITPATGASILASRTYEHRWLIEGLLERADRLMLTGGEGKGKSLLMRQIAVMCASGIHPWKRYGIRPLTVLIVDLENSEAQIARSLADLLKRAGSSYDTERLYVECRPQGIDLASRGDVRWLDGLLGAHRPDMLIFGSLYKAYKGADGRSKSSEESAEIVARSLDELRVRHDCALLIEAHAPHGEGGDRSGLRPAGSSLWLRWPEAGFGLKVGQGGDAELLAWRGLRDRLRLKEWPRGLARGHVWPWEAIFT